MDAQTVKMERILREQQQILDAKISQCELFIRSFQKIEQKVQEQAETQAFFSAKLVETNSFCTQITKLQEEIDSQLQKEQIQIKAIKSALEEKVNNSEWFKIQSMIKNDCVPNISFKEFADEHLNNQVNQMIKLKADSHSLKDLEIQIKQQERKYESHIEKIVHEQIEHEFKTYQAQNDILQKKELRVQIEELKQQIFQDVDKVIDETLENMKKLTTQILQESKDQFTQFMLTNKESDQNLGKSFFQLIDQVKYLERNSLFKKDLLYTESLLNQQIGQININVKEINMLITQLKQQNQDFNTKFSNKVIELENFNIKIINDVKTNDKISENIKVQMIDLGKQIQQIQNQVKDCEIKILQEENKNNAFNLQYIQKLEQNDSIRVNRTNSRQVKQTMDQSLFKDDIEKDLKILKEDFRRFKEQMGQNILREMKETTQYFPPKSPMKSSVGLIFSLIQTQFQFIFKLVKFKNLYHFKLPKIINLDEQSILLEQINEISSLSLSLGSKVENISDGDENLIKQLQEKRRYLKHLIRDADMLRNLSFTNDFVFNQPEYHSQHAKSMYAQKQEQNVLNQTTKEIEIFQPMRQRFRTPQGSLTQTRSKMNDTPDTSKIEIYIPKINVKYLNSSFDIKRKQSSNDWNPKRK